MPFPFPFPPSMDRLYTLGVAASIEAVESEQSCHSHSLYDSQKKEKIVFGENFMDMKINLHLEIHDVDVFYR